MRVLRVIGLAAVMAGAGALAGGCARASRSSTATVDLPPGVMRGAFTDDYDNRFEISDTLFAQQPHGRFHIVEWNVREQYAIAHNDASNASDPGLWTRIDWMRFEGMAPYTWGFCLTAYKAPTRDAARATPAPDRAAPRKGCNGYPFSRMKPR